ncbi:MAG: response regulator [Pyrinomonadaceae bacterium]
MRLEFESHSSTAAIVQKLAADAPGEPTDFGTLLKKGIAAAQSGERDAARTLLVKAAEMNPISEDAWMWLASISDYPEELLASLNHVLRINPSNKQAQEWRSATVSLLARTLVQRAVAANKQGSVDLAMQCLDQAIAYDESCEMAWFWKASLTESLEQKLSCLERVLAINPDNKDAADALAMLQPKKDPRAVLDEAKSAAAAGKRKKAVEMLDAFLEEAPGDVDTWILKSHLSLSMDEKIKCLQKALELEPDNTTARSAYDFLTSSMGWEPVETDATASDASAEAAPPSPAVVSGNVVGVVKHGAAPDLDLLSVDELFDNEEPVSNSDVFFEHQTETAYAGCDNHDSIASEPAKNAVCPICRASNEPLAFRCAACGATLSLSDIELLLSPTSADRETVQQAVTRMEAEWNLREFDEQELTALAIAHFNLNNPGPGLKYLQEASRLNPNNVILSGQVNTIAIRLDEIRRQAEMHESMPRSKTILVVDDSATVRKLISGKLEKSGHNVVCAVDGVDALEKLAETSPDLVLLDITMPRMDGYEVCKQIRANPAAKDTPVVMISGRDGFFDKVRGKMAGTTAYITKPFGPETLMKALETYLLPEGHPDAIGS